MVMRVSPEGRRILLGLVLMLSVLTLGLDLTGGYEVAKLTSFAMFVVSVIAVL
jgi:hypothetical protein